MRVGIPTETKNNEFRVAITPAGVAELTRRGHEVLIQAGAGEGSAITDADFKAAGAQLVGTADQVWADADLLLKVKEPIAAEYGRLRHGQILFTFLHLAASRACTDALLDSGTTSIAYETVQTADGALPLLAPMSEVAGRLAAQVGRLPPDANPRGPRCADGRGARRRTGRRRGDRRRHRRLQRSPHRQRHGRDRYGSRHQHRQTSATRRRVLRPDPHSLLIGLRARGCRQTCRPGDWGRPGARRQGTQISLEFTCRAYETRCGTGGYSHRPGRLFRRLTTDHLRPPDVRRARHAVLLRGEHARLGAEDVDLRADQRDDAVCARACRPWLAGGVPVESGH